MSEGSGDAYRKLATELRRIGDELEAIATAMAAGGVA
jgi:hypothetical protein